MNSEEKRQRPLEGLLVVDFSMHMAGPFCTRALSDMGAEVIKIEPPAGDNMRTMPPLRDGVSSYFGHVNVGKKSVVLDLKDPDQRAAALGLAGKADIVIENGRPGAMCGLGLDYNAVKALNPRGIYCSISGYGQEGPGAQRPAFAMTIHASCGVDMAHMAYQDNQTRPSNVGVFTADFLSGVYALSGILSALYERERTGIGQHVDVALMDCMLSMLPYEIQESQFPPGKRRNTYKPLACSDGYVMLALITPKNFAAAFDAIGLSAWRDDPRLASPSGRAAHWDEVFATLEQWTSQRTSDECLAVFSAAGVPIARYQTVAEAIQDPQLAFRQTLSSVRDSVGEFLVANQPFKLSASSIVPTGRVPALGEHTEETLRKYL
jgi:crotonobetainyl-CoA:carnitine CoA-transferase CaiB-like acyl-CoA transferase